METLDINVLAAISQRASTRAFLDKPIPEKIIEKILDCARWSPSGGNLQPWQIAVVRGKSKQQISAALLQAYENREEPHPDYIYYPSNWFEPYKTRRFQTGMALYNALNIQHDDKERRRQQWKANYHFFGAPVGLFFLIDKGLGDGALVDMGMYMQSVMLAALAYELTTCPQASLTDYPDIIRKQLGLADNLAVLCGMAMGYADTTHPVNNYRTEREAVKNFSRWYD